MNIISSFLLLFLFAAPSASAAAFPDVSASHEHAIAIEYVRDQGIVSGYPDGTYGPENTVNRAEFTKIVIESVASREEIQNCNLSRVTYLSDVDTEAWYVPYLCVGVARGIISGHLPSSADPYFGAAEPINLIAAAKVVTAAMRIGEPPLDCLADWGRACIEAAQQGDPWYRRHVLALEERNAIPLSVLGLQQYLTRGEMAEIIYRLDAGIEGKSTRTYEELKEGVRPTAAEWREYRNDVVGYRMEYPVEYGAGSNTYAISDAECAIEVSVGPIRVSVNTPDDLEPERNLPEEMREYLRMPLEARILKLWSENRKEAEEDAEKELGSLDELTVDGAPAYRFWTTGTFASYSGGWVQPEKGYVLFFDDGDRMFQMSYSSRDAEIVDRMIRSYESIDATYTAETLYDAALACDAERR